MQHIVDQQYPCSKTIIASTGTFSPEGEACGTSRYCQNCEEAVSRLSNCGDFLSSVDVLTSVLLKCFETWVDKKQNVYWARL